MKILLCICLVVSLVACSKKQEPNKEETIRIVVEHEKKAEGPAGPMKRMDRNRDEEKPDRREIPSPQPSSRPSESGPVTPLPANVTDAGTPAPPSGPLPEEAFIHRQENRAVVKELVDSDPRVRELIKQGNISALTQYLVESHPLELDKLAKDAVIKDRQKIAAFLSRGLMRRGTLMKERTVQTQGP
ncbi:MAG: hypothetical protein HY343_10470 [Lentisphaerae bacterium]|nr:hypothetical protein [Lentisphaerota bacterium]